jgi:hypothetical protein
MPQALKLNARVRAESPCRVKGLFKISIADAFLRFLPKTAPVFRLRPRNARARREKSP